MNEEFIASGTPVCPRCRSYQVMDGSDSRISLMFTCIGCGGEYVALRETTVTWYSAPVPVAYETPSTVQEEAVYDEAAESAGTTSWVGLAPEAESYDWKARLGLK